MKDAGKPGRGIRGIVVQSKAGHSKVGDSEALSRDVLSHCEDVSAIFASLAHPTRLKVLCLLMSGEQRVSELTEFCGISQPAMSQFLLRMRRDGLVTNRREGVEVFYRIVDPRLIQLLGAARDIYVGN